MQRYFIDPNAIEPGRITVRGDDVHHIKNVLRMTVGDHILCCDGQGKDYYTELVSITDKEILCRILSTFPSKGEPRVRVTVASSLPKGDKLEWVLQKATELGADSFLPFMSSRSVVRLDGKKSAKKRVRWQRIVKEAAEQSHRGYVPQVGNVLTWKGLLEKFPSYDQVLFAYEREGSSLVEVLQKTRSQRLLVVVGPEGGFTESEVEEAVAQGAVPVQLGPRILRAETAPLALLSCILFSFGEMGGEPL
ncbi:16S rRNA (uracil(1498)-N(3))-methyltransferase [Melghirimyces algeriensis]|uniref:Ribosomal RNA small subunit methyltransferase E n=1 Tax=Melghirimyces algeriensis TaxID=910412 RepID=A0A521BTK2_9BACL|nr:16S rRNA (uracil(1498)-N(3))-methyltransferase [Melghirimyces algeriensis]SMO50488.1 16S rRNA (uracil1498-N3)-methyltransferase [Melghirimyces algeriensis]